MGQITSIYLGGLNNWSNPAAWDSNPFVPNNGNGGNAFDVSINGGSLTQDIAAGVVIQRLNLNGGSLTVNHPLTANALFTWTGGSHGGTSVLTAAGGGIISGTTDRTLTNATLAIAAGQTMTDTGAHNLFLNTGGVLNNAWTFLAQNDTGIQANNGNGSMVNSGTYQIAGAFANTGTVNANRGTLAFLGGGDTQTAGTLQLAGGNIASTAVLNLQGGLLTGSRSITAAIQNNATITPALGGAGFAVTGNLSLLSGSNLSFQLGGLTQGSQYGFISVNGAVALGGSLVLSFANGFEGTATNGNIFTLVSTSGAFSGSFANVLSGGRLVTTDGLGSFVVTYSGNSIALSNFNPAGLVTSAFLGGTGAWSNAAKWDTNPLFPQNGNGGNPYNVVVTSGSLTKDIVGGVIIQQRTTTGGSLTLSQPLTLNAGLQYSGGNLNGGTLNLAGISNQNLTMLVSGLTTNNSGSYNLNVDASNAFSGGANFNNSGTVAVQSGTLQLTAAGANSGTISAASGATLEFLSRNSFLSGSTFSGAGVIQFDNNTGATIQGTINNSGTIQLTIIGYLTWLLLGNDAQLVGGGVVSLAGASAQISGAFQLTNLNNQIQGFGNVGANSMLVLNQAAGVVYANVTGQVLFVDPPSVASAFVNQGLLEATSGGLLQLSGNGGGAFTNTGGTILAGGTGSEVELRDSVILSGGTLQTSSGGVIPTLTGHSVFLSGLAIPAPI